MFNITKLLNPMAIMHKWVIWYW